MLNMQVVTLGRRLPPLTHKAVRARRKLNDLYGSQTESRHNTLMCHRVFPASAPPDVFKVTVMNVVFAKGCF